MIKQRVNIVGGFSYEAYFSGAAQIKPWSLLRMVEASRAVVFDSSKTGEAFLDADHLYKDFFFFILASSIRVRKQFYQIGLVKAPIDITVEVENIGKTSLTLKSSGFVNSIPYPLFVNSTTSVFVCKETRQPKPPPSWWVEKFLKEFRSRTKSIERLSMSGKDDSKSTLSRLMVHASDVDVYHHTNWTNYVKYCYNAFVERCIVHSGCIKRENIFREVSQMSIVYKKESSIGDLLTIKVSPHQTDPDIYYFDIHKGETVACECKLEFHPL